eukprot:TRINITY_DN11333_c0_g1_i1.p1 TRINITY_DN11333_c0_g1~~TRINITY_DN11333_c0_g1_i1.p1  ORF type:complete len:297 (-),score=41.39 TRINITY_DN11333_c0_g1_i1:1-891(-)
MLRGKKENSSHLHHLFCDIIGGTFRGWTSVVVGYPLDLVKVRLQIQQGHSLYKGSIDCFVKTVKNEGFLGLYKGSAVPFIGSVFQSSICFLVYGQAKRIIVGSNLSDPKSAAPTAMQMALLGISTGFINTFVNCPFELLKTKMQVQKKETAIYRNSFDCFYKITKHHGIKGLYQGLGSTISRNSIGDVFYFGVYEKTKFFLYPYLPNALCYMTAGSLAGLGFWTSIYPIDVVKSIMQAEPSDPKSRRYKNMWDCAYRFYSKEGLRGFWKGYLTCAIRSIPTNACGFLAYEFGRNIL